MGWRAGLRVLTWPMFDAQGVDVVVTTRHGGVSLGPYASLNLGLHVGDDESSVVENRRRAAAAVGARLDDLVFSQQVHGARIGIVGSAHAGCGTLSSDDAIEGTDGLVTGEPGVGLVMMAADCTPIVLFDPRSRVLGCVHSGWRGTVARVADAALVSMEALGSRRQDVMAAVGPTVDPRRYQVGPEVVEAAAASFDGRLAGIVTPDGTGRWTFDLREANVRILTEAGVDPQRISVAEIPTGGPEFFSDRQARPCGRIAAIAKMGDPNPAGAVS